MRMYLICVLYGHCTKDGRQHPFQNWTDGDQARRDNTNPGLHGAPDEDVSHRVRNICARTEDLEAIYPHHTGEANA